MKNDTGTNAKKDTGKNVDKELNWKILFKNSLKNGRPFYKE